MIHKFRFKLNMNRVLTKVIWVSSTLTTPETGFNHAKVVKVSHTRPEHWIGFEPTHFLEVIAD